ncbi:hypothetical protein [Rhodococcus sp. Leaf233]|uniref:hypothetical protein n=1 Tax=Rhodococcus sp. Leaf233 TaxID=1736302 RepID=UPI00070A53D6|nr:hypothetical protein [Rhodococcus sp. Leaf233]KQU33545.1 hypothetical protein ASH04_06840 [Rhodococcus sp. Leaf233]
MSVEHEQQCERTIASVVHEIDDLKHQLADALDSIRRVRAACSHVELVAEALPQVPRTVLIDTILEALETK